MAPISVPNKSFTVGWICALPTERAAATAMLDEIYQEPQEQHSTDTNQYVLGRIKKHNVAIACLPAGEYGLAPAATAAQQMLSSFPKIRFGLLVGIGGGIPAPGNDIRLGDVVISEPHGQLGGVVQYDRGKTFADRFERTGFLNAPPRVLLNALNALKANHLLGQIQIPEFLQDIAKTRPPATVQLFSHPGSANDILYGAVEDTSDSGVPRGVDKPVERPARYSNDPVVHYGLIASGNQVIKDATTRNRMRQELGDVLCFEMEAAGLMNAFPCLVIRGVSDYADYRKNDMWHGYAAATAAAAAKEVLYNVRVQDIETADTASNAIDFLQSLSFPEMNRRRQEIDNPSEGTCSWLLQDPLFIQWKKQKNGLLWLTGKPGSGKSTLLKHTLQHTESEITLSFFFYDRGSELQRTCRGLYQTLLHQLLLQYRDVVREHVSDIVDTFEATHRSYEGDINTWVRQGNELQEFLRACLLRILATYDVEIVIDALDECAREDILVLKGFFKRLQTEQPSDGHCLRLCITCRHYPLVKWTEGIEISVDQRNHADIQTYIGRALQEIEDDTDRLGISNDIIKQSNGVFLWVILVLPAILYQYRAGFDADQIRSYLQNHPTDLYSVFKDIINQLSDGSRPENDSARSLKLFQWLCFANRPLALTELRISMNINVEVLTSSMLSSSFSGLIKDDKHMEKRVKSLSGGLAEVKKDGETSFVQLIHQTVKDYLIHEGFKILDHRLWSEEIVIGHAHVSLAAACIQYMSMDQLVQNDGPISADDFPFLDYAICSWIPHAEKAEALNAARDEVLICFDWPSSRKVESWVRIWSQWYSGWPVHETTLLHASARHGFFSAVSAQLWKKTFLSDILVFLGFKSGMTLERLQPLARSVLQTYYSRGHQDINCKDESGRTPLSWASEMGQVAVVRLLLAQEKVDVDSRDIFGRTPLLWATTKGHGDVIRELAKRSASVNTPDRMGMTPLHVAAKKGDASLALLLVESGAELESPDGQGRTPLHEAVLYGHGTIVQALIDAGADVHARDKHGDSTLHRASGNRNQEVARSLVKKEVDLLAIVGMLLRHSVDINARNHELVTPLHRAARNGRKALVSLMLENGAEATTTDHRGRTPLDDAIANEDEDIIQILGPRKIKSMHVDSDDASSQDFDSGDATERSLKKAARSGQEAGVLQLLDQPEVDIATRSQAKALRAAALKGHVAIVKLLLERNSELVDHDDVEAALRRASGEGKVDIVRLLLDFGVSPRAPHEYEPSALHRAAATGQEETARLILRKRPGPGDEEFYGGFALHYAARAGQPALVELLLKNGSYASDRTSLGGATPLHAVAETRPAGQMAILQILARKKAYLDQEEPAGLDRYKAVVRVLLKKGADPRIRNSQGQTPLELAQ